MLDALADRIGRGETVEFRPAGGSMAPLIHSRRQCRVAPVDPALLEVGDIVLARVSGSVYLHLVSAVDTARRRVQISNNRGRVNGWTGHDRVFGICLAVDGVARPGAAGKVRRSGVRPPLLATRRLDLVPLHPSHADEMALVLADPALHAFTGGAPLSAPALRARYERLAAGSPTRRSSGPTGCCGCAARGGWSAPSRPRSARPSTGPSWPGPSAPLAGPRARHGGRPGPRRLADGAARRPAGRARPPGPRRLGGRRRGLRAAPDPVPPGRRDPLGVPRLRVSRTTSALGRPEHGGGCQR